jgi:hypothetical protein
MPVGYPGGVDHPEFISTRRNSRCGLLTGIGDLLFPAFRVRRIGRF